MKLSGIHF